MSSDYPVVKRTVHAGKQFVPITKGSKVHFHFQTWKLSGGGGTDGEGERERVLLDDSRQIGKRDPMVLVIGHKFKLEVWEEIVKMMSVGEVASFTVNQSLVFSYPFVSKTLRDLGKEGHKVRHSCTMTLQTEGIGYKDLDELMAKPCDLEFIIELLKAESAEEYEKELWQLDEGEKLSLVPRLRESGNKLYGEGRLDEAELAYAKALGICEQLLVRERKHDTEWERLQEVRMPILLNYAQCKLRKGDYYAVIEHCNTILEYDKDNEKALYRRARAHAASWSPELAERDLRRLRELRPALAATVDRELADIRRARHEKDRRDKTTMRNLFATNDD